tara:strand:+ start:207 stop:584 length:378 start_codon:yes stop_codon:yes gene_type:complete
VIDIMGRLLLALLLISPASFADWGDVYYCQMKDNSNTSMDGKHLKLRTMPFKFQMDKERQLMIFDKSVMFAFLEMEVDLSVSSMPDEVWIARGYASVLMFHKGDFSYSTSGLNGSTSISARCDKF